MRRIFLSTCLILLSVTVIAQRGDPSRSLDTLNNDDRRVDNQPLLMGDPKLIQGRMGLTQERMVLVSTDYGDIKLKLYNATPLHRDNFIKLVEKGFFDSLLFHRVIKDFMIQGGDPQSKNAEPGKQLGSGDVGYTIPAEFNDSLFHKKGALCAARTENPEKVSSGCQFYIVHGRPVTDEELTQMENNIGRDTRTQNTFQQIINRPEHLPLKRQFMKYQQNQQQDSLNEFIKTTIMPMIEKEFKPFEYSARQRELYKALGGTPQLDQAYTVFGEVVEGLDVVDKIAAVQTATADRPVKDVRMKMKVIQ